MLHGSPAPVFVEIDPLDTDIILKKLMDYVCTKFGMQKLIRLYLF